MGQQAFAPPPPKVASFMEKVTKENTDAFAEAANWEDSRIEAIETSERRAWTVAAFAVSVAVVAMVAIIVMLPLKEKVPYITRVDRTTGAVDVINVLSDEQIGYEAALDKYFLGKFVRARETYDWYTIQHDYDETLLLAGPTVRKQYTDLFEGENALDKRLGKSLIVNVKVLSISPDGAGTATVRYIRTTARAEDPQHIKTTANFIATIGYEYRSPSRLSVSERMLNPLGFQVTSYRTDEEFATPPPEATQGTAADET